MIKPDDFSESALRARRLRETPALVDASHRKPRQEFHYVYES